MPRGIPKKVVSENREIGGQNGVQGQVEEKKEDVLIDQVEKSKNVSREKTDIEVSREQLKIKLDPSQEFYESPSGYIVIGEKGRGRVFCRQECGGKGMWINPKR